MGWDGMGWGGGGGGRERERRWREAGAAGVQAEQRSAPHTMHAYYHYALSSSPSMSGLERLLRSTLPYSGVWCGESRHDRTEEISRWEARLSFCAVCPLSETLAVYGVGRTAWRQEHGIPFVCLGHVHREKGHGILVKQHLGKYATNPPQGLHHAPPLRHRHLPGDEGGIGATLAHRGPPPLHGRRHSSSPAARSR